ncbi:MAG: hypothetical protein KKA60_12150 [Proteobacteria bacterium]|nr:hypothetical protein [Pseudomonadota bacterium]
MRYKDPGFRASCMTIKEKSKKPKKEIPPAPLFQRGVRLARPALQKVELSGKGSMPPFVCNLLKSA